MSSGQRSGPVRRRKRRGKTSERASLIPKSTLSEIFSADDESDEEVEFIDVEPEAPEAAAKRAPWWSVHPVPPPPRRASSLPPSPRRAAVEPQPEVPPLDAIETPLTLQPPPVFESPSSDAPVVSASEPARPLGTSGFAVRATAALCVLGASVVFGFGLGRAPDAKSAASVRASEPPATTQPVAAPRAIAQLVPAAQPPSRLKPAEPALPPPAPATDATTSDEGAPGEAVLSLDDAKATPPSALGSASASGSSATSAGSKPSLSSTPKLRASSASPPFDSVLAASAINAAAQRAAACRSATDPQGVAMVMLKYAPSGRVTTAVIEGGPFAGTTVGGCIAMAFRGAHVTPFSGEPVTVRKSVTYP